MFEYFNKLVLMFSILIIDQSLGREEYKLSALTAKYNSV